MKNVRVVQNAKSGAIITPSSNPKFGFMQLEEKAQVFELGWMREVKKSTLVRAEVAALQALIAENRTLALPGKIVVQEYLEAEVPEHIRKAFLSGKNIDLEKQTMQYVKRAGNDGPILTVGDDRILRFTWYDRSGLTPDIKVNHDNAVEAPTAEAVATEAKPEVASAELPQ